MPFVNQQIIGQVTVILDACDTDPIELVQQARLQWSDMPLIIAVPKNKKVHFSAMKNVDVQEV